jgi:signal transduction histidine kinase
VLIDQGHASSILTNLLMNALQAATEPCGVFLNVQTGGSVPRGYTAVDISDTGTGVPETLRERIFEPFFTTKAKGTGLGLPLARDLARMNGGDVRLLASSSSGSTFRVFIRNQPNIPGRSDSQNKRLLP